MASEFMARILVVDDEPSVLETIAAILARDGYDVVGASGVSEAFAWLQRQPFDLVLTDLRMEGPNGLSLIAELRRQWPQTLAIMLTGYASLESAIDALREGAYDYLIKPCDVGELRATIARAVERCHLSRALQQRLAELDDANAQLRALSMDLQRRVEAATVELSQKVEELTVAKARLEEAHQQRAQFISMVAHELNQPLTTIAAYAQLLQRGRLLPDREAHARAAIYNQTVRLQRLVKDLADTSHLTTGQFRIYPATCDMVKVVQEQVEIARMNDDTAPIAISVPDESVIVTCDRDRIAQVISNLLGNALKYASDAPIEVRLTVEDDQVRISVTDHGPGIPADRLSQIFEPFVRLNPESGEERSGVGLGLYIVKGIVEAHGGRIWVESIVGQGTTFLICLPLVRAEPNQLVRQGA